MKRIGLEQVLAGLHLHYNKVNKKVKCLNKGGCGIFAVALYDILIELGYKPQIVVITNDREAMRCRVHRIDHKKYASVQHMVVKVGKYYVDSTGFNTDCCIFAKPYVGRVDGYGKPIFELFAQMPIKVARQWNENPHQWNSRFRRMHIPTVQELVKNSKKKLIETLELSK